MPIYLKPELHIKFDKCRTKPLARLHRWEWEDRLLCEQSFAYFIYRFWPLIEGRPCVHEWYVDAIAEHLEALQRLDINNLLINQPFRTGKSLICSVLFVPWIWIKNPNLRFLYTTYKEDLTLRDSRRCRQVMMLPQYQRYWGDRVILDRETNSVHRFATKAGGWRIASSVQGGNTGEGGDYSIIDDPNNIYEVDSETVEDSTNNWLDRVMTSRVQRYDEHRRLVTQQRAGLRDLSAHIIKKDSKLEEAQWTKLILPMEYIPGRKCTTIPLPSTNGVPWSDPRTQYGEVLCPKLYSQADIVSLKNHFNNDPHTIACQLQQNPTPEIGGMIRPQWFKHWTQPYWPRFIYILQSWDTALVSSKNACHSSATTWGVFKDADNVPNVMLLSLFAGQVIYPDLKKMAQRLAYNYEDTDFNNPLKDPAMRSPHQVVIEKKVSGYCLHDDLFQSGIPVSGFNPSKYESKIARCSNASDLIEAGLVWLPCESDEESSFTDYSQDYLDAAIAFPSSRRGSSANDIIDSGSQAFIILKQMGLVSNNENSPLYLN